jgi:DNA-binding CsgD family transcriptional regulator/Tfp pilus assembly protein PilF
VASIYSATLALCDAPASMGVPEFVQDGQAALAAADWARARECFELALRQDAQHPEALDGLGRALHFQGEYGRAIELTERAFAAYLGTGRGIEAADRARWLAFLHGAVNANMSVAGGWMARAESALEGVKECSAHGWLQLDRAPFAEEIRQREQLAASALAIARRFGDIDLEYDALSLLGEAYVADGRVEEGMKLLDQAMAAVISNEVTGIVAIGDVVCRLLSACEIALDLRRADEWMQAAPAFEAWKDWISPVCRNHYGGILVAAGRWAEAEAELESAIRTFERSYRLMREDPLVKLADLRVRQGRYEEARRLIDGHESHPLARRALAMIALGRGELDLAEDLVHLCLEGEGGADPRCAPVIELQVRVRLARDDLAAATEARNRLNEVASASEDARARAHADLADGLVAVARGEPATASLQAAVRRFSTLALPLEAARAQFALARSLATGTPRAAVAEAQLALRTFERIGARPDADAAAALLRELGATGRSRVRGTGTLTAREAEVLALLAQGRTNAEIAERLVISRRTAEHHVANILSKLDLRTRAEAAAYALQGGSEDR